MTNGFISWNSAQRDFTWLSGEYSGGNFLIRALSMAKEQAKVFELRAEQNHLKHSE
jgi:hypothetical protein